MIVLGLTGSIGMGKSTAAATLRRLGVPVHDADRAVHRLMAKGGKAVPLIARAFPDAVTGGAVDRAALGRIVFADRAALTTLEHILHPMVRADERRFLAAAARRGARLVVLDIPLLFETGGERRCDATIVVSAPKRIQRQRVLARPGMTEARLAAILAKQMPDDEKRRRADFVVPTGLSRAFTLRRLAEIVRLMRRGDGRGRGRHWPPSGYHSKDIHARNRPRHRNHRP